jgi:hypothetical protein
MLPAAALGAPLTVPLRAVQLLQLLWLPHDRPAAERVRQAANVRQHHCRPLCMQKVPAYQLRRAQAATPPCPPHPTPLAA